RSARRAATPVRRASVWAGRPLGRLLLSRGPRRARWATVLPAFPFVHSCAVEIPLK
ncbi:unnamed protein product, partial [Amoebophrya sp. A120]